MAMKGIEDWAINTNAGTITHKSGTVFTFESGEIVDIDLKGVPTKELRILTNEAILLYGKKKTASTSYTNESGEVNAGNSNPRRPRLSLSKKS
jgi:hypothetical protein